MRLPAMLFLLALVSICVASETLCPPQCRQASRPEDLPTDISLNQQGLTSMGDIPLNSWLVCNDLNGTTGTVNNASILGIPCMGAPKSIVAMIGYPFGVLLTRTLASYSRITNLALVKGEITDIEDNALTGLVTVERLDLTYNRLVHVKQSWFSGLTFLVSLDLSSNQVVRMDPGCFNGLSNLHYLYLNDNLLRNVEADWFTGLNKLNELNLESNCIEVIAAGTFQHLTQLYRLSLAGNGLTHLDGGTFWGLNSVIVLGIIGARSDTVHDTKAHEKAWSLLLGNSDDFFSIKGQDVSVKVSNGLFCVVNDYSNNEQTLIWTFDSSTVPEYHTIQYHTGSCSRWDIYSQDITSQAPFVVMIQHGSSGPHIDDEGRCRQVWVGVGITLALVGDLNLRLVSFWERNAHKETLAIVFDQTQKTNSGRDDSIGVTCFLLMTDSSSQLVFNVLGAQNMINKTYSDPYGVCKDQGGGLTSQRTSGRSTVLPGQQTTLSGQHATLAGQQTTVAGQTTMHMSGQQTTLTTSPPTSTILGRLAQDKLSPTHPLVLGVLLPVLTLVIIVVLLLKKCSLISDNHRDIRVNEPRDAVSRRARPASVPATSRVPKGLVSCKSMPSSLTTIGAVYYEIPDEAISAAQRPLPALPHTYWEIPDDCIPDKARSTSLPSVNNVMRKVPERGISCRSLPASLRDVEPTYGDIPEDDSDGLLFYAAATDLTLPVVRQKGARRSTCVYRDGVATKLHTHKSASSGSVYGRSITDKSHRVTLYGNVGEASLDQGMGAHRTRVTAVVSSSEDQDMRTYINARNVPESPSSHCVTPAADKRMSHLMQDITQCTCNSLPNPCWPWQVVEEGGCNMQRTCSQPALPNSRDISQSEVFFVRTRPNTYWSWPIVEDKMHDRKQSRSLSVLPGSSEVLQTEATHTLSDAYWPWEVAGGRSRIRVRWASLPALPTSMCETSAQNEVNIVHTFPNTYWPWEIPASGQWDRSRPVPPMTTLPNTYWPWHISARTTHT